MSQLICSKCGREVKPSKMRAEESLVTVPDGKVLFSNRWFDAECPACGSVLQNKIGHHASLQTKELKKQFPKAKLPLLRSRLSDKEFKRLKEAREGKRSLTDEELTVIQKKIQ